MSTSGDILSTLGDVQYIGGCSVNHDIIFMWGSKFIKAFNLY